jgi:arginine decarboxylase
MENSYRKLIKQTFQAPNEEFKVDESHLFWNDVDLVSLIKEYGSPLRLSYLPSIQENMGKARLWMKEAMNELNYEGSYHYCYCTKSSHFKFVLGKVLDNDGHIETSSAFDVCIIEHLFEEGSISKDNIIVCNGYKTKDYLEGIVRLLELEFNNVYVVLDNKKELSDLINLTDKKIKLGIRVAAEEAPNFEFYTSRLGIRYLDVLDFYLDQIKDNPQLELNMLHFFVNSGISDSPYYWSELNKTIDVYLSLKKYAPKLNMLDIGGGFPIKNSLNFDFDYQGVLKEILKQVKDSCNDKSFQEPDILTEFGKFTVGESGALIYGIIDQKDQNDRERWNMINSSFMTTLPDSWAINERFILLAVNAWEREYERVFLGGLTCDSYDYYNSEQHSNAIYLPKMKKEEPLFIGFFNTGAYQESLGGYGGVQHCLIPQPKHLVIDKNEKGELSVNVFKEIQAAQEMFDNLGYK